MKTSFSFFSSLSSSLILAAEFSLSVLLVEFLHIVLSYLGFYDRENHRLILLIDLVCVIMRRMSDEVGVDAHVYPRYAYSIF